MRHRKAGKWSLCRVLFTLLHSAPTLSFFLARASFTPTRRLYASSNGADPGLTRKEANGELTPFFTIPIFPLRKTIKLPGERTTLNLYEERYLALGTWILQANQNDATQRVFGALYVSDKPQIVSEQGMGPIVPMIRTGDIGVIFPVEHYEEGMIPTLGMDRRRRIRIVGTGVARFCIEKILHNGYGGGEDVKDGQDALPFILAQVSLYRDDEGEGGNETSSFAIERSRHSQPISEDEIELLSTRAKAIGIPEAVMKAEFQSFLIASTALPNGVSDERKKILKTRSPNDRVRDLLQKQ